MNTLKRISRKELRQPDRVQESLYGFVDYAYKNQSKFIAGTVLAVVIFFSVWGRHQYYVYDLEQKSNSFVKSMQPLDDPKLSEAEKQSRGIETIHLFLRETPNHFLSVAALMQLGELYVQRREWEDAGGVFSQVINHSESSVFIKNMARMSLSGIFENQNKWENAKMTAESLEGPLWEDIRLKALARIALVQGDRDTAKTYLQQLVNMDTDSSLKQQAELMLMTLN